MKNFLLEKKAKRSLGYILKTFILFLFYFFTARFGLTFNSFGGFATLIWIPSGLSLAALILFGYTLWPGIFLGAFFANLLHGAPPIFAGTIALGNTLESVICFYFLGKFGFDKSLERHRDVLLFIFFATVSTVIAATIGTISLFLSHLIVLSSFSLVWQTWWIGDLISIILLTSLIIVWSAGMPVYSGKKMLEAGLSFFEVF
jgi:integral membrane sensor domain MASE1